MSLIIYIDEHEPETAEAWLSPSISVQRTGLNRAGWADYMYGTHDGVEHVERKQVGEILSDMDSVEDQLRRELLARPDARLWLLIEGLAVYSNDRIIAKGMNVENGYVYEQRTYRTRPAKWARFLLALNRLGVLVVRTNNFYETCVNLVSLAKSGEKPHTTLNRPVRPKIFYHQNPHVRTLMGIPDAGLGPKKAAELVNKYGTVYKIMTRSPEELATVPGIGVKSARKLLRAFGRSV